MAHKKSTLYLLKMSGLFCVNRGYRGIAVARVYDMQFTECHKHYGVT